MLADPLEELPEWVRTWARCTIDVAEACGLPVTVTSTVRSCEEQQRLRDRYELGLSRWPAARPGESAHQYGFAWDSDVPPALEAEWYRIRVAAGWHVPMNDRIHAEVPGWRNLVPVPKCGALAT